MKASDGNFKPLSDSFLKGNGLDAHQIKDEIYGKNNQGYDIYINKNNGDIMTGPKNLSADTELQPTGFNYSDGQMSEGFSFDFGIGPEGEDFNIE